MEAPFSLRIALITLLVLLGFFAGWTFASVPLTLSGAPFSSLWLAGLTGLAGAIYLALQTSVLAPILLTPALGHDPATRPRGAAAFGWAGVVLSLLLAGAYFIPSSNAFPFWMLMCITGIFVIFSKAPTPEKAPTQDPAPSTASGLIFVALLGLVCLLYLFILRHDGDDSFYLNLPIGLQSAAHGMLVFDTMYGVENWPVLGSNYRLESLPTLTAALAWSTGLDVVTIAHVVLPMVWCLIWVCFLAVAGHGIFGRGWWIFGLIAVLSSMVLAGTLQSWGTHGIARLYHGKGPLVLIILPFLLYAVARTDAARLGYGRTAILISLLVTAALGLTANAVYLAPLALGLALLSGVILRKGDGWQRVFLGLAAWPVIGAGLWLFLFDRPVSVQSATGKTLMTWQEQVELALWSLADSKGSLILLIITFVMAVLAGRFSPAARWITIYFVLSLILVFNPFLWSLYSDYATGGLNFRLWWGLPIPLFLGLSITWLILQTPWRQVTGPLTVLILIGLSLGPNGLIGMEGTSVKFSAAKLPEVAMRVANKTALTAKDRSVLAPEEIATWLPILETRPPVVYTRRLYLWQSEPVVPAKDLAPRRLLAEWINGEQPQISEADIRSALEQLNVGALVLSAKPPANAQALLTQLSARKVDEIGGFEIYALN